MPVSEPTRDRFPFLLPRLLAATRPAFLGITLLAVGLGFALALRDGAAPDLPAAIVALLFALITHAAANVINDFHDAQNGSDAVNTDRVFPFTGGSRFIQNGVLSARTTAQWGYGLLLSVVLAGLWLSARAGSGLVPIGLVGLLLAWSYSAPPLRLMSRGLGEPAIVAGWLLVVCGSDYVLRHTFSLHPLLAGLPLCLLLAAILYLNQVPDLRADAAAGKRTLVVRLGAERAAPGYWLLILAGHGGLIAAVAGAQLPASALYALVALPLNVAAAGSLQRHARHPQQLRAGIVMTIAAAHLFGVVLIAAILAI